MSTKVGFKRELLKLKATRLTHLDPATTLGYSLLDGIKETTPFKYYLSFFFAFGWPILKLTDRDVDRSFTRLSFYRSVQ